MKEQELAENKFSSVISHYICDGLCIRTMVASDNVPITRMVAIFASDMTESLQNVRI
jgi:hypothetical protein